MSEQLQQQQKQIEKQIIKQSIEKTHVDNTMMRPEMDHMIERNKVMIEKTNDRSHYRGDDPALLQEALVTEKKENMKNSTWWSLLEGVLLRLWCYFFGNDSDHHKDSVCSANDLFASSWLIA